MVAAGWGRVEGWAWVRGVVRGGDRGRAGGVMGGKEGVGIGLGGVVGGEVVAGAMALAKMLARKAPRALRGTKRTRLRQRDDPNVARGLDYVATHNAAMLMSNDLNESLRARFEKREPIFAKL